jgi:hypothetical protein
LQSMKPINCRDTILVAVGTGKLDDGKVRHEFNARGRVAPHDSRLRRDTHG